MELFKLSDSSEKALVGIHTDLVAVVRRAIVLTVQDFGVHDGLRSIEEQKALLASGATKTLDSRHITGHAVDLVPFVNGKLRWEWEPIYKIADSVRIAAKELDVQIRWGGAWDISFTDSEELPEHLVSAYSTRMKRAGKKPFLDGPHFELLRKLYP